jgi:DNA mismatch repair ATPase MutS
MCLFATHFHELKNLELLKEKNKLYNCVKNLKVTADISENEVIMLYKVEEGSTEKSFGLNVAKLAKFPDEVINIAKRKLSEFENDSVVSKKKKLVSQKEGEFIIHDFLKEFSRIQIDKISESNNLILLKNLLKSKVLDKNNKFIQNLINESV